MSSTKTPPDAQSATFGLDLRKADAAYKPFPPFAEWAKSQVDTSRWDRYTAELKQWRDNSSQATESRALEIVKRAASFDTGAIEGLYETDRGFTFTVATQAAFWEAAVEKKGSQVRALFEAQLHAYDYVLDLATQAVPIAEAWIRDLHAEICRSQDTYQVWTEIGPQEQPLPKGEYKHLPNHVIQADGTVHSYAPVDLTPPEMYRLCEELRSETFLAAHPALQASYVHYALVALHPFADGNGRVARALASVFTYRSQSVPLLILVDSRKEYYESLAAADERNYQPFVDFILERILDAIRLASNSIQAATLPSFEEAIDSIRRLYITKGGYSHTDVDQAGIKLFDLFLQEMQGQARNIAIKDVLGVSVGPTTFPYTPQKPTYRLLISGHKAMQLTLSTAAPANAQVQRKFILEVPRDCGQDDDLVIQDAAKGGGFEARITELIPTPTAALQMRISIEVEKILREALSALSEAAAKSLKK